MTRWHPTIEALPWWKRWWHKSQYGLDSGCLILIGIILAGALFGMLIGALMVLEGVV